MSVDKQILLICVAGAVLLLILALYAQQLKFIIKTIFRTLLGFLGLIALNFTGQYIGISLGLNIINSVVLGVLGLPGLGALLFLQWLY